MYFVPFICITVNKKKSCSFNLMYPNIQMIINAVICTDTSIKKITRWCNQIGKCLFFPFFQSRDSRSSWKKKKILWLLRIYKPHSTVLPLKANKWGEKHVRDWWFKAHGLKELPIILLLCSAMLLVYFSHYSVRFIHRSATCAAVSSVSRPA